MNEILKGFNLASSVRKSFDFPQLWSSNPGTSHTKKQLFSLVLEEATRVNVWKLKSDKCSLPMTWTLLKRRVTIHWNNLVQVTSDSPSQVIFKRKLDYFLLEGGEGGILAQAATTSAMS